MLKKYNNQCILDRIQVISCTHSDYRMGSDIQHSMPSWVSMDLASPASSMPYVSSLGSQICHRCILGACAVYWTTCGRHALSDVYTNPSGNSHITIFMLFMYYLCTICTICTKIAKKVRLVRLVDLSTILYYLLTISQLLLLFLDYFYYLTSHQPQLS